MSQHIWSPNWENVPGSTSTLLCGWEFRLSFWFWFIIPGQTPRYIHQSGTKMQAWFQDNAVDFAMENLECGEACGLVGKAPSRVSTVSGFLPHFIYDAANLALTAVNPSHSQSWQCPGKLEARSQACSALSLKLKQDYLFTFFNRWEYQITLPVSWENFMWVKKQQLELDIEQMTGSKLGKGYDKAAYCHPVYLTYMQNTP